MIAGGLTVTELIPDAMVLICGGLAGLVNPNKWTSLNLKIVIVVMDGEVLDKCLYVVDQFMVLQRL